MNRHTVSDRDPVAEAADDSIDLYEIASWEPRTLLDRLAAALYSGLSVLGRLLVVLLGLVLLAGLVMLGALGVIFEEPIVTILVVLSALPSLGLAAYVWYADPTTNEPLWLLVAAFILGVLFASFAALVNSVTQPFLAWIPVVGLPLFFYLVVAPIEETVKLLAVRLSAYEQRAFNTVVDGAVYGAFAGLGFAAIENTLYVSRGYLSTAEASPEGAASVLLATTGAAAVRSLVGPGHVIYTAIAGFYLGLAKFTPGSRGPIVVKGLLIAALIHATYNTLSGVAPNLLASFFDVPFVIAFVAFVIVYDGIFVYFLYRKIDDYRSAYRAVGSQA